MTNPSPFQREWIHAWESAARSVLTEWLGPPCAHLAYLDEWKMTSLIGDIFLTLDKEGSRLGMNKTCTSLIVRFDEPKRIPMNLRRRIMLGSGQPGGTWKHQEKPQLCRDAQEEGKRTGLWVKKILSEEEIQAKRKSDIR